MPIQVLPEDVASQIAAGEVVERPSSAVKELVENSIDAGASDIRVEAREGGKRFIRVADDGCGVPTEQVEVAFQRHSTSKLSTADDLEHITTLGFRGEALASIAAVSRLTFATRDGAEPTGSLVRLEGGSLVRREESGRPSGTTVTVEDLFFNLPARRKFLRTDRTERRHIDSWIASYALAYPAIRLTLLHDGQQTFQSPGSGRLRDVLVEVYGLEVGAALLEIAGGEDRPAGGVDVRGFTSPPSLHRANRSHITLFVNGRWVKDTRLTYAIIQAYHTMLPGGRYPLAIVMVSVPPGEVDVNVHPAKAEVRFRDGDAVFRAVQRAVRATLLEKSPVPAAGFHLAQGWPGQSGRWTTERRERLIAAGTAPGEHRFGRGSGLPGPAPHGGPAVGSSAQPLPPLRVVGQLGATYIVVEGPEGMYLVDQHAAHERVLFEKLLAEWDRAEVASQPLLNAQPVELAPDSAGRLEENLQALAKLGFELEPFGGSTMLVRAMPVLVAEEDPRVVLEDTAAALVADANPLGWRVEQVVARRVCKRAAIKAGKVLAHEEMAELMRLLEQCASPRTCPHGRPTMIHLSVEYLARQFGRGGS
ncbi:MAG: DNA mismatch repair endonuclease MutL [Anaerolineales bacterium]|nr:MAG: DNA mismatch repair endonuclease MutL [Anaerolineales bacterium]